MALPMQTQAKYWGLAAAGFLVLLWVLGDVLFPFILGSAIAYMLDPVADRLERMGLSRALSVAVIAVVMVIIFLVAIIAIVPEMVRQTAALIDAAPGLLQALRDEIVSRFPMLFDETSGMDETLAGLGQTIKDRGLLVLEGAVSSAGSLFNIILLFVVVPVVAVYMLVDWDNLVARIDDLLPLDHRPTIRRLAGEMDRTLASFIRGQGTVCLIQGTFYAVSLTLVGLNFGLPVGALAGLISFIPLVGSVVGGALAIGLAIFQFWGEPLMIALVAGIFFFGQIVEGNILTPKLVGSSVGLHPVWLLLALSVFGAIFGFVGLLVAVPVAAMLGVLVRFLAAQYKDGLLYKGSSGLDAPTAQPIPAATPNATVPNAPTAPRDTAAE